MATIPLTWNDPLFNGLANSDTTTVKNGGTLSNYSTTQSGDIASVVLDGAANLNDVRINSREGVRIGGSGDINISNSYIQTTGLSGDHADGIQAYDPGGHGNITISNTTIVSGSDNATAGLWIADQYSATVTLNNVVFEGGPYGLRIADDAGVDDYLSLNNVYFVGPFDYGAFLLQEVNANIHITAWNNVRYATIVNGVLVPGALIAAPWAVEGSSSTPPPAAPTAPVITSGDHVTNDNTVTVTGTAAAGSTVTVFDGTTKLGTTTVGSNGTWSYTTAALTDGKHSLTATDTVSGQTSAASSVATLTIDTKAPAAPVLTTDSVVNTNHVLLSGTAEANSTVTVYDGTTAVGTATAGANGAWSVTTSALSTGSQVLTATATDAAGNTSGHSGALDPVIGSPSTPTPSAPVITSGDHVTNDNTVTVAGTAAAGSVVTVLDDTTKLGTVTVGSNGAWSYTTTALTDGKHSLTATDTSSGKTSVASSAVAITVDTHAPAAPVLVSDSVVNTNHVLLSGTAEANSAITVYDGTTAVGTATAGSNGVWSVTTGVLATGSHVLTATATDAAGNTSGHSQALDPVITSPTPNAPAIVSYSNDTGLAGDHITSDNTLALTGTAAANTTVTVFDGTAKLGTATVDGTGAWHYVTAALNDGSHSLTATDTNASGHTSVASPALAVTIDTYAPAAPTIAVDDETGKALSATTTADDFLLKGTAEANSTVHVFDDGKQIGTVTATSSGLWSFDTGQETDGSHSFTSTATDAAGNVSAASAAKNVMVDAPTSTPAVAITDLSENHRSDVVTITGTADANSQVKLYDGTKAIGTVEAGANGTWTYTSAAVTNTTHTYSAQELDSHGHVVASSGNAILGTTGANTLTSTSGNNLFVGNGHPDTFVFASNFGNDVIKDFNASGWSHGHDVIEFSKSVFDNFADVLSHATQSGQNVVITDHAGDSLTLNNVKLSALDKHDFHFA